MRSPRRNGAKSLYISRSTRSTSSSACIRIEYYTLRTVSDLLIADMTFFFKRGTTFPVLCDVAGKTRAQIYNWNWRA